MVSGDSLAPLPLGTIQVPSTLSHASLCHLLSSHHLSYHLSHRHSHFSFLLSSRSLCTLDPPHLQVLAPRRPVISLFHKHLFGTCSVLGLNLPLSCGNACQMGEVSMKTVTSQLGQCCAGDK